MLTPYEQENDVKKVRVTLKIVIAFMGFLHLAMGGLSVEIAGILRVIPLLEYLGLGRRCDDLVPCCFPGA